MGNFCSQPNFMGNFCSQPNSMGNFCSHQLYLTFDEFSAELTHVIQDDYSFHMISGFHIIFNFNFSERRLLTSLGKI